MRIVHLIKCWSGDPADEAALCGATTGDRTAAWLLRAYGSCEAYADRIAVATTDSVKLDICGDCEARLAFLEQAAREAAREAAQ